MKIKFEQLTKEHIWDETYIKIRDKIRRSNTGIITNIYIPVKNKKFHFLSWGKDVPIRTGDFLTPERKINWYSNPIWLNIKASIRSPLIHDMRMKIGYYEIQNKIEEEVDKEIANMPKIIPPKPNLSNWQKVTSGNIKMCDLIQQTSSSTFIVADRSYENSPIYKFYSVYRKS